MTLDGLAILDIMAAAMACCVDGEARDKAKSVWFTEEAANKIGALRP